MTRPAPAVNPWVSVALAAALTGIVVAISYPHLDVLSFEYDEGPFILGARFVARGLRPFVDFAFHQPPLHLYLLALSGKVFGPTLFGYRMLSVVSLGLSGFVAFWRVRPLAGPLPALPAQAVFLFSASQFHSLNAVGEPPMLLFTLLGVVLLFLGTNRLSAYAAGVAFVVAMLIKPTCILLVVAAALSLVYARARGRVTGLPPAGVAAAAAGLAWTFLLSDGIFADVLRFTASRVGAGRGGMWSVDTGFAAVRRILGVEPRAQGTLFGMRIFYLFPRHYLPLALFVGGFVGVPIWVAGCARTRPALAAFAVLWPASSLLLNFTVLDYVSTKYFIPFLAFTAFLVAGVLWRVHRYVPPLAAVA